MDGSSLHRDRRHPLRNWAAAAASALAMTSCASDSYQVAAMEASNSGDYKAATSLAKKEVLRFSSPDQCSPKVTLNCGTLALAYGTLASYQILDGDRAAGEDSFRSAKRALSLTNLDNRPGAIAIVFRDVSEAYWKSGDRTRAIEVFKEGSAAGADKFLYMSSAARFAEPPPADLQQPDQQPPNLQPTGQQPPLQQPPSQLPPSPLRNPR